MQTIERIIISHFLTAARAAGFIPHNVDDGGDERVPCTTDEQVLAAIDSVDDCRVYFGRANADAIAQHGSRRECLVIVLGNGEDCISDMSLGRPDWDALVNAESAWASRGADELFSDYVQAVEAERDSLQLKLEHEQREHSYTTAKLQAMHASLTVLADAVETRKPEHEGYLLKCLQHSQALLIREA